MLTVECRFVVVVLVCHCRLALCGTRVSLPGINGQCRVVMSIKTWLSWQKLSETSWIRHNHSSGFESNNSQCSRHGSCSGAPCSTQEIDLLPSWYLSLGLLLFGIWKGTHGWQLLRAVQPLGNARAFRISLDGFCVVVVKIHGKLHQTVEQPSVHFPLPSHLSSYQHLILVFIMFALAIL